MVKPNQAAVDALKAQLAGQLVGHHMGPQSLEVYKQKPTNYVFAKNGIFRVVPTDIALFVTKIGAVEANVNIPGVGEMEEGPQLLVPKIPFKYWLQVLSFYHSVYDKDKTEASVLFFWNKDNIEIPTEYESGKPIKGLVQDGQFIIYCPDQKNSSGLSDFTMDTMVPWLRAHTAPLCETHSHHTMGAFWSATDNANENMTQFYGVYGKIKDREPEFLFRYVSGEHKINIPFWNLFEKPRFTKRVETIIEIPGQEPLVSSADEEVDYKGPWPIVEFPADWLEKHSKSYTYAGSAYNQYGYQKGPTQASQGRGATPSNGGTNPYANWPEQRDPRDFGFDDYEDGYYGGAGGYGATHAGGAKRSSTAGSQKDAGNEVKKNNVTEISSLAGKVRESTEEVADVVETDSSYIELIVSEIMDTCDANDIKLILRELCDYGYDYVITDLIKEQGDWRYADM